MDAARQDPTLFLNAALDGELDAAGMIEIEAQLAGDPSLAAEYARLTALREAIRTRLPHERAPDSLRAGILARVGAGGRAPAAQSLSARILSMARSAGGALMAAPSRLLSLDAPARAFAASLMLGVALGATLGAGGAGMFRSSPAGDDMERALVAGYVRGRLTGQPVDVATSDRHTVKPWLAAKIADPTTVVDLAKDGFPLVGGRIDVVGMKPVATLIYQKREHQIALSEMAAPAGATYGAPRRATRDGYSLLSWGAQGRLYTAVSDMPPSELDAFHAAFRREAAAEREGTVNP